MFQDIINNNIIIMTQKQSARIECKNNLFKLVYSVKQPRTIKTVIYIGIFTSIKHKTSPTKQFKEFFGLCPNHFRWNGIVVCEV